YAAPDAAADGDVGAARQGCFALPGEALGDEGLGLGEDLGDPVAGPGNVVDVSPAGHRVALGVEVADRAPGADPGARVEAQDLVDDHGQVGKLVLQLVDRRRLPSQHPVLL